MYCDIMGIPVLLYNDRFKLKNMAIKMSVEIQKNLSLQVLI